jgi:hypothetical protein
VHDEPALVNLIRLVFPNLYASITSAPRDGLASWPPAQLGLLGHIDNRRRLKTLAGERC